MIYLVHFARPLRHARHYLGSTELSLRDRFDRHLAASKNRRGSALMRAIFEAGIDFKIVRVWPGGRDDERAMKNHGHARRCPVCRGEIRYEDLECLLDAEEEQ